MDHPGVAVNHVLKTAYGTARPQFGIPAVGFGWVVDFGPFDLLAAKEVLDLVPRGGLLLRLSLALGLGFGF